MSLVPGVLVHGGAGSFQDGRLTQCISGCERAALEGASELSRSALDAVIAAVKVLEDDPNFNAGVGATLTRDGTVELDAAVMTGDLRFGAVGACPPVPSAIELALEVLLDGEHTFLVAHGAAAFAQERGIELLDQEALVVERVLRQWKIRKSQDEPETVGAVALDAAGRVAAATSTGGILFKRIGRVGDTPVIGAGTYADDTAGAASATGQGESIMRAMLCRGAIERLADGAPVEDAGREALSSMDQRVGGKAGLILIDRLGNLFSEANTEHMPWGAAQQGRPPSSGDAGRLAD